jgi:altronate dehydratase
VSGWLPGANATARSPQPLSALSVAQQCGGSDAFSGVSGNPCAGEACKLLIAAGGKAVLAETDELMGAESYILRRVKDIETCVATRQRRRGRGEWKIRRDWEAGNA